MVARHVPVLLICSSLLAGCAGNAQSLLATTSLVAAETPGSTHHTIFVATTRDKGGDAFTGSRADETSYAEIGMSMPPGHKAGTIERSRRRAADAARDVVATRFETLETETAFTGAIRADLAARNGRVLVFVHGYHNTFDDAVYRTTQLVHDSGYTGTPVLFSWASAGRTLDYVYDNNSATAARDALEDTLRALSRTGASQVDIIAHSMGNWVTVEALRQLEFTGDRDLGGKLGDVVLASPDIDIDVFKAQMRRYGKPTRPFVIIASQDDRALLVSRLLAGDRPRVGGYSADKELAELGLVVVDLTNTKAGDPTNHAKFVDNPVLVKLLGERLNDTGGLTGDTADITGQLANISRGLGKTVGSAVELVITTPFEVLDIATGGK